MANILKLNPFYSEKVWGYEEWNLSTHKNGHSTIEGSEETLFQNIGNELPILIKIIQANDKLSVQVHPEDEYSRKYENDNGKTECWYVLEASEDATLVCGIKEGHTRESFLDVINNGEVESHLQRIKVSPKDMIYIPAGTVHAIEGGIKILEVQQSSDVTYRMYDWGRDREMHIEKSLDVIDYEGENKGGKIENFSKLETPYFTVENVVVDGEYMSIVEKEFESYTVIDGCATIYDGINTTQLNKEETVYIKNGTNYTINGNSNLLKSYV